MTTASAILDQLGGSKFVAMTGANCFVGSETYLSFSLPARSAKRGINKIKIRLNSLDLYNAEFLKVNLRKSEVSTVARYDDVSASDLQSLFTRVTGLDTHL